MDRIKGTVRITFIQLIKYILSFISLLVTKGRKIPQLFADPVGNGCEPAQLCAAAPRKPVTPK